MLIDFMLYGTAHHLCGVRPMDAKFLLSRELFVIPSLQGPAPFHALCAVASWAWNRQQGICASVEALRYKQDAVRLINTRIGGDTKISDEIILAVALVWKLEARFDNLEDLETHVDGLMQMISLRGGLGKLNQRLQLVLAWFTSSQPGTFASPFFNPSEIKMGADSSTAYLAQCSQELIKLLQAANSQITQGQHSSHQTNAAFSKIRKILDRLLSPEADKQPGNFRGRPLLKSLCRLASLLWLHRVKISYNGVIPSVESQIDQSHDRLCAHGLEYQGTVVMFWHLLLKQEGSFAVDHSAWPVVRMMSVAKRMNMELVDEVADLLWVRLLKSVDGQHDKVVAGLIGRVREATGFT